jgi:hypothetical protein
MATNLITPWAWGDCHRLRNFCTDIRSLTPLILPTINLEPGIAIRCERLARISVDYCGIGGVVRDEDYQAGYGLSMSEQV